MHCEKKTMHSQMSTAWHSAQRENLVWFLRYVRCTIVHCLSIWCRKAFNTYNDLFHYILSYNSLSEYFHYIQF
jgi:hypothetical protein